ncbi:hypothetical protein GCM10023320_05720 [Pseudonocardia adelaidensis]|uniref:Uncharacterized protein n=1 Tax=Pseudonocardia adelaidensis TaxID=648754 RepID=A0ABP9N8K6_9PSEU
MVAGSKAGVGSWRENEMPAQTRTPTARTSPARHPGRATNGRVTPRTIGEWITPPALSRNVGPRVLGMVVAAAIGSFLLTQQGGVFLPIPPAAVLLRFSRC